ncbi:MBL fold metallo-hydrolase [Streptodolium elevatio]|uniref:MBL fold metallo-hydrolase n=1 Tax=Streptodolium elevatio TaxID=3157996 RepID=A0ABV3DT63_9ACTN
MRIHELNCGTLNFPGAEAVLGVSHFVCRCLLIEADDRLIAVDTGIGHRDIESPGQRLGEDWLSQVNPALDPTETLLAHVLALGLQPRDLTDVILTHHHRDHVGGLADFPWAHVHATPECRTVVEEGTDRVVAAQWSHGVRWAPAPEPGSDWRGHPTWIPHDLPASIRLLALPGHSPGHAGVVIGALDLDRELVHVGDAIHHCAQLTCTAPPAIEAFAAATQHNETARLHTQRQLAALTAADSTVRLVNAHDPRILAEG